LGALFEQVLNKYPDHVKIVFKHFPLSSHRFAATAALASVAAQEQGKFWQYHDLIFENFRELNDQKFIEFAQKLELNLPLFTKSMNSQKVKDKVIKDYNDGREVGVTGTPAVFINGRRLRDRSFDGFQKLIDKEIKKNM
jgi:protein-disulfide isomerase